MASFIRVTYSTWRKAARQLHKILDTLVYWIILRQTLVVVFKNTLIKYMLRLKVYEDDPVGPTDIITILGRHLCVIP